MTAISPEVQEKPGQGTRALQRATCRQGLRQNQRVSVRVVLESKPDTIKVQRGSFLDSGGGRIAYVVHDGVAERRGVRIGSSSLREVEVLDGPATRRPDHHFERERVPGRSDRAPDRLNEAEG